MEESDKHFLNIMFFVAGGDILSPSTCLFQRQMI